MHKHISNIIYDNAYIVHGFNKILFIRLDYSYNYYSNELFQTKDSLKYGKVPSKAVL